MTQAGFEFAALQPGIAGVPPSLCPAEVVSVFLVGVGHQEKLFGVWQAEVRQPLVWGSQSRADGPLVLGVVP